MKLNVNLGHFDWYFMIAIVQNKILHLYPFLKDNKMEKGIQICAKLQKNVDIALV